MIRSALRSVSYLAEDVGALVKWAVGEVVAELDYRLQPAHVREGWAAELADIEAGVDVHEPYAPYLQWGGPETWPQPEGQIEVRQHFGVDVDRILQNSPYCNRCGYPHPTTQTCLRDATAEDWVRGTAEACGVDPERCVSRLSFEDAESSAVPPTAERPAGVVADPPSAPPAGHPYYEVFVPEEDRVPTSELLRWGAVCADVLADMTAEQHRGGRNPYRLDAAAMRNRADAFQAIENTT